MSTKKNKPKGIDQALNDAIVPLVDATKPIINHSRAEEVSMKDDTLRNYKIGLEDIDSAIMYHIKSSIKPIVIDQDETVVSVPVKYAYPEMWASAQRDGGLRDKDGKVLFPVIAIKRDEVTPNLEMGGKLDGNKVNLYRTVERQYTKKNIYVPDYVIITYSCAVYVNNQRDLNKILESFNFASRSYWGDKEKNMFHTVIDTFPITMEMNQGENRKIYSLFNLTVNAHLLPDTINRTMASAKKFISKAHLTFTSEITS